MGIDGIGKGRGVSPGGVPGEGAVDQAGATRAPFSVDQKEASTATSEASAVSKSDAARVRAGEISIDHYLDLKVNEATHHLQGIGAENLSAIKAMLRDQLASDPALADLVKSATGHAPPAPKSESEE